MLSMIAQISRRPANRRIEGSPVLRAPRDGSRKYGICLQHESNNQMEVVGCGEDSQERRCEGADRMGEAGTDNPLKCRNNENYSTMTLVSRQ
jgi:hypothetical protein